MFPSFLQPFFKSAGPVLSEKEGEVGAGEERWPRHVCRIGGSMVVDVGTLILKVVLLCTSWYRSQHLYTENG